MTYEPISLIHQSYWVKIVLLLLHLWWETWKNPFQHTVQGRGDGSARSYVECILHLHRISQNCTLKWLHYLNKASSSHMNTIIPSVIQFLNFLKLIWDHYSHLKFTQSKIYCKKLKRQWRAENEERRLSKSSLFPKYVTVLTLQLKKQFFQKFNSSLLLT